MSNITNRATRIASVAHALADLEEDDREIAVALSREIADAVRAALKNAADDDDVPF